MARWSRNFNPGTGANAVVNGFALQFNGAAVLGGNFTAVNGVARNFVRPFEYGRFS